MAATSVRLPDDLLDRLDRMAEDEHTDRSTVIKRALEEGLRQMLLDRALDAYGDGRITAWRAARMAGVSLWTFMDELERRGRWFHTDEETLLAQIAELA